MIYLTRLTNIISICVFSLLLATQAFGVQLDRVELKGANIRDAARILSSLSNSNITVTQAASNKTVDLLLQNISLEHAVETLSRITGLWYRRNSENNSYLIMTKGEYQSDIVVYRNDTIRSFTLKHQNVRATALTIQSLFGERVILKQQNQQDDFDGLSDSFRVSGNTTVTDTRTSTSSSNSSTATVDTTQRDQASNATIKQQAQGEVSDGALRNAQASNISANDLDKKLGIQTPIFIATNRIHNLIHVRTSDKEAMSEIASLIRTSDRPTPQVLLETKIIRITNTNDKSFSLGLDFDDDPALSEGEILRNTQRTRLGLAAATGGFYEFYSRYINLRLEALERTNLVTTITKPLLLASNNRPARIFIGNKQIIATGITPASTSTTTIDAGNSNATNIISSDAALETEEVNVGNSLAIMPSINSDKSITLDIFQSNTSLIKSGMEFPYLSDDEIKTTLLDTVEESTIRTIAIAKDGYTIALGGNITTVDSDIISQIPVLGDLPLLGSLFKNTAKTKTKSQYIMLITPHIILSPELGTSTAEKIAEVKAQIKAKKSTAKRSKKESYLYLNRYAAMAMSGNRPKDNSIVSAPLPTASSKLFSNPNITSNAIASYQQEKLVISVFQLKNTSNVSQPINLQSLPGRWLSAAREQPFLAAKDVSNNNITDTSYVYLISRKP